MLKIENTEVLGWEHAIRGMRNPMNSWEKSDSGWSSEWPREKDRIFVDSDGEGYMLLAIGPNDRDLMMRLRNTGTDHRKFMRMITVYLDITAPLYWWKEFDTYKVGTVANSCSTMHKIAAKEFTLEDFSSEHLLSDVTACCIEESDSYYTITPVSLLNYTIELLNKARELYLGVFEQLACDTTHDEMVRLQAMKKKYWWQMIQLLPSSYNQKRTVMLNYEVLANIYKSRRNHKLDEWHTFCDWIESLPYSELITGKETTTHE